MAKKKALILGVGGQDGSYLAKFLLDKGYQVHGTSRDCSSTDFSGHKALGIQGRVRLHSVSLIDFKGVYQALKSVGPGEVYNLAGQSSVGLSFAQPIETFESIVVGSQNLLESMRLLGGRIKLYNASSGECFGDTGNAKADESTAFRPRSPYGVAKAAAFWAVANYRQAYRLHASSGILFNHESPLRPERFVTRKIVSAAARIARGSRETLRLGDLSIRRDWGWAPEYVAAMWAMLQKPKAGDYVLATGVSHPLKDFVKQAFGHFGLDWKKHVVIDKAFFRPDEIRANRGNASKAARELGWKPKWGMKQVVIAMCEAEKNGAA